MTGLVKSRFKWRDGWIDYRRVPSVAFWDNRCCQPHLTVGSIAPDASSRRSLAVSRSWIMCDMAWLMPQVGEYPRLARIS